MKDSSAITCMFVDIGGVLLTDGWGPDFRARAAQTFNLDPHELEIRHQQAFSAHELDKISFKEYLDRVVFHQNRQFTFGELQEFIFAQSQPYSEMIELIRTLKRKYGLKIVVVSNEGRELNKFRIRQFKLDTLADFFVSSCYVRLRKPDPDIFRLALDAAQVPIEQLVYLENTAMFVQVAEGLGIRSILHTDYETTCAKLAELGLKIIS